MDDFETMRIKKEVTDEVPNVPGSMFLEESLGISYSTDIIGQEPEVILEVDETQNITLGDPMKIEELSLHVKEDLELKIRVDGCAHNVVTSARYETDSTRLIKNGERCRISFEEPLSQGVVHEELDQFTEKSAQASICGIRVQGLTEEGTILCTRLKCSSREKEVHRYSCSSCLKSFRSKYRLIMHVFNHINAVKPPTYVCKLCGEVFPGKVSLNKHLQMSEGNKGLSDSNCEKIYSTDKSNNVFQGDVIVAKGTKKQSSSKKTRKISKKSNNMYNMHTKANDAEKEDRHDNYQSLSTNGNASRQAAKPAVKRPHKCDVCGKAFMRMNHLNSHYLQHTGLKPHKCDFCGKSFTQIGTLNRHAISHTGNRAHKCDVCGKSFVQSTHLKNHYFIHTGVRPHKCDTCGKCFTEPVTLRRHVLIHTGIRRHKCDTCGKTFTLLGDLNRHTLIHTGIRPHTCHICGKSFIQLGHLKGHILNHTGKTLR